MSESFKLYGGSPTAYVNASAVISAETETTATIKVTASGWLASGSWVQSSGIYAAITINGSTCSKKKIFGDGTKYTGSGSSGAKSVTYSVSVPKTHASQSISWSVAFYSYIDGTNLGNKANISDSTSVAKKTSYVVAFNANGGSGAPANATKWHGESLTLSTTTPTRSNYTFLGWATSSNATSATYSAGGSYTANKAATLYAVWKVVAPNAPSDCINTRNSDSSNTVTWTRGSSADTTYESQKIERQVDGGSWSEIASVSGTATSYTDATTSANHYYRYRVRAYNTTGYSGYATSGYTYNTPSAPTKVVAARASETSVTLTITNSPKTATALEIQRSTDARTWATVATISGAVVTSATDEPSGGTFYYRARNTRGKDLASAWSPASAAVVTICAPNAPTLVSPASGAVISKSQENITFEWKHVPIDGSAQTEAEVAYSLDNGSTWEVIAVSGNTALETIANAFNVNSKVIWKARTKGVHEDYSPWSSNRVFYVYKAPSVAFEKPSDSFVIREVPIEIELHYEDESGSLANASLIIEDADGVTAYTLDMGTSTTARITAADWIPDDGGTYILTVYVRSSSTLTTSAIREVTVEFALPKPAYLDIEADPETGYVSIDTIVIDTRSAVLGSAILGSAVLGSDLDTSDLADPVSINVYRVTSEGRVLIGEGLRDGAAIMDKYAPLNIDYRYESVTFAESGAINNKAYDAKIETPWWFIYYGEGRMARSMLEQSGSRTPSRPNDELIYADGREWPVLFQTKNKSDIRNMSGWVETEEEADAFHDMTLAVGDKVFKSLKGDVFHCKAEAKITPDYTYCEDGSDIDVTITRISGGVL